MLFDAFSILTFTGASRHSGMIFVWHLKSQKWSEHVFFPFWLRNVLRATAACTLSTSEPPKAVRTFFGILISKCQDKALTEICWLEESRDGMLCGTSSFQTGRRRLRTFLLEATNTERKIDPKRKLATCTLENRHYVTFSAISLHMQPTLALLPPSQPPGAHSIRWISVLDELPGKLLPFCSICANSEQFWRAYRHWLAVRNTCQMVAKNLVLGNSLACAMSFLRQMPICT